MKIKLKAKHPLFIIGPKASGKSTRAREIASAHGEYIEMDYDRFLNCYLRDQWPLDGDKIVKTIIVDGVFDGDLHWVIQQIYAERLLKCNRKNQTAVWIHRPFFIFTGPCIALEILHLPALESECFEALQA